MKKKLFLIILITSLFNISFCSNLFFQWKITDKEKEQLDKEIVELIKTNTELYKKLILNYQSRNEENSEEPILGLSRYTECQKCLKFVHDFKSLKNKFGFPQVITSISSLLSLVGSWFPSYLPYDIDTINGLIEKYGYIILENFYSKFMTSYFFCEKADLCPVEKRKNYDNADIFATKILETKKGKEKEKPQGKNVLKMLQITDLHIDPLYLEGSSSSCTKPICCRKDSTSSKKEPFSGKYGFETNCDVPWELFDSFLEDVAKKDVDIIIWTGDNAPHDVWNGKQETAYEIAKNLTIKFSNKLADKNIPIFYSLGNHESYPNDNFRDNEDEKLAKFADIYEDYIGSEGNETFRKGGYYTRKYKDTKLRFISLNCFVCDSFNFNLINSSKTYTKDMFNWLESELKKAEKNNEFVFILNHFPLNADFMLTECAKRFQALFDRYEYIIRGIFSGHTHLDDIEGITGYFNRDKIIHLNFIAPQFTTYSRKLPSYRIYTIDKETMQVIDYEQFRFNLTKSNNEKKPYWETAYKASEFFKVNNLLDYNKIINCENMEGYILNRYSGSKVGESKKDKPESIKEARCAMTTNNFDEYFKCLNPEIGLNLGFVSVITNFLIGPFENFNE